MLRWGAAGVLRGAKELYRTDMHALLKHMSVAKEPDKYPTIIRGPSENWNVVTRSTWGGSGDDVVPRYYVALVSLQDSIHNVSNCV